MNALENLLIIAGISLDIFAAMECQGSLVSTKKDRQKTACQTVPCTDCCRCGWQMAHCSSEVTGDLSGLLYRNTITHNEKVTGFAGIDVIMNIFCSRY